MSLDRIAECMRVNKRKFTRTEDKLVFLLTFKTASCRCQLITKHDVIIFLVFVERRCPEQYRQTMMRYLNSVNYGVLVGYLACDPEDGEVRSRHSIEVEHVEITPKFVDNMLQEGIRSLGTSYKNIQKIMSGKSLNSLAKE